MRKRKWWFVGLGLAFLAAGAGIWKWSERPPYACLAGGQLIAQLPPGTHGASAQNQEDYCFIYLLNQPYHDVLSGAKAELQEVPHVPFDQALYARAAFFVGTGEDTGTVLILEPIEAQKTEQPHVLAYVTRRLTLATRFHGWLHISKPPRNLR